MANTLKFGNGEWATKEGSTLAYNSENGNFKPLPFTFDRSTSATRVNKEGLIEVVSNNEPRIDFLNDSKGALLLEPSRTNYITKSERLDQWSRASNATIEYGFEDPFKGNKAVKATSSSTAQAYQIYQSFSSAGTYNFSIYAKKGTANLCRIDFAIPDNGYFIVNLETGESAGTSNFAGMGNTKIEPLDNDWYRISFTSTTVNPAYYRAGANHQEGFIYMAFAQIEQGSYATSYIPTQGSIGTRVAESCEQTVPDGVIGQTEGTVFLDSKMALQNILNYQLFSINNGGNSDRIRILTATGNRLRFIYQLDGGTTFYSFYNPTDYGDLTNLKIAFTYKSGDIKVYINGVLADSSTNTFTIAEKLIDIDIASSAGGYNQMLFNDIKLYNKALTDAELISLTS